MIPEFTLPTDWDQDVCSEMLLLQHTNGNSNYNADEEFSAASTEVSMIYEQFQMENDDDDDDDDPVIVAADPSSTSCLTMMDVDTEEQIAAVTNHNLLLHLDDDEIFHDPCLPPSGGMEYLESISLDDRFSLSLLEEEAIDLVDYESCSYLSSSSMMTTTTTTSGQQQHQLLIQQGQDDDDDDEFQEGNNTTATTSSLSSTTTTTRSAAVAHHPTSSSNGGTTTTRLDRPLTPLAGGAGGAVVSTTSTTATRPVWGTEPEQQERYKIMLDRLAESMRRSQETRKSLTIHTVKTQDYYFGSHQERRKSLTGVLSSVEKSTSAIQERLLHYSALS